MNFYIKNLILSYISLSMVCLLTGCGTSIVNVRSNVEDSGSSDNQSIYGGQTPVDVKANDHPRRRVIVRNKGL